MNEKGFTLVEAIIAVAIAGVMAVVFIPLLSAGYVNIQKTGDKSDATYDAVERAEESVIKVKNDDAITDPKVTVTTDADDKVEIPGLDIEEPVNTITVKGEDKKETQEKELIVSAPNPKKTP